VSLVGEVSFALISITLFSLTRPRDFKDSFTARIVESDPAPAKPQDFPTIETEVCYEGPREMLSRPDEVGGKLEVTVNRVSPYTFRC